MCGSLRVTKSQMNDFINGRKINGNNNETTGTNNHRPHSESSGNASQNVESVIHSVAKATPSLNFGRNNVPPQNQAAHANSGSSSLTYSASVATKTGLNFSNESGQNSNYFASKAPPNRPRHKVINPYIAKKRSAEVVNLQNNSLSKSTTPSLNKPKTSAPASQRSISLINPYGTRPKQFQKTSIIMPTNIAAVSSASSDANTQPKINQSSSQPIHNPYVKQVVKSNKSATHQSHHDQNRLQNASQSNNLNQQQQYNPTLCITTTASSPPSGQVYNPYAKNQQSNRRTPAISDSRQTSSGQTPKQALQESVHQQNHQTSKKSAQPPSHQNHDRKNCSFGKNNDNIQQNSRVLNHPSSTSSKTTASRPNDGMRSTRQQKLTISSTRNQSNSNVVVERNITFRQYQEGPVSHAGGDITKTWIYPKSEKYAEREYQLLISQSSILQNTLVSLPTGLGKTLIAAVGEYRINQ